MTQASAMGLQDLIGKRLTIRLHESSGGYRDIVGILASPTTLQHKDGHIITFSPDQIAIYREIIALPDSAGKGAPLSIRIIELEKMINSTWGSLEEVWHGQWLFRASGKFTMRANSIVPLGTPPFGEPDKPLAEAIQVAINFYKERKLKPVFSIPLPLYEELDTYLGEHGWEEKVRAQIQVSDLKHLDVLTSNVLNVSATCTPEWLEVQNDQPLLSMMGKTRALYYSLTINNVAVAVARAGLSDQWAVITRFFVKPEFREQKLGQEFMTLMINDLLSQGATKAALQVDGANNAALALYAKLGFRKHHEYSYRIYVGA